MAVQTTYSERQSAAYAGMIANTEAANLVSYTVEDAAGIGFGVAVSPGTADNGATATGSGDTVVLGVTTIDRGVRPETPNVFAENESALVMTFGVVWVNTTAAVAVGEPAFVNPANGGFYDADGGSYIQIAGARWESSTAGAGLAKLRLS